MILNNLVVCFRKFHIWFWYVSEGFVVQNVSDFSDWNNGYYKFWKITRPEVQQQWCHRMSCDVMWCHGMSWDVMGCHKMSWDVMGCHGMSWDVTWHHVTFQHWSIITAHCRQMYVHTPFVCIIIHKHFVPHLLTLIHIVHDTSWLHVLISQPRQLRSSAQSICGFIHSTLLTQWQSRQLQPRHRQA